MSRVRKKPYPQPTSLDSECPICREPHTDSATLARLSCGHSSFCFSCIENWAKTTNRCPLCSRRFHSILECSVQRGSIVPHGRRVTVADCDPPHIETPTQEAIGSIHCDLCEMGNCEEDMLLCDGCDRGFHTHCLGLKHVPNLELWFCEGCLRLQGEQVRRKQRTEVQLATGEKTRGRHRRRVVRRRHSSSHAVEFSFSDSQFDAIANSLSAEDFP